VSETLNKFEDVLTELQALFEKKNAQYGDSAFEDRPGISNFQLWMRLSDVRRKTVRLDSLTDHAARGDRECLLKLIDDYKDLAVYAVIAVMVLEGVDL
jgi:hypothetical protein